VANTTPCLTFAPLAWLKLQYLCHSGPTEVGGFAIASEGNPLHVEEFVTVQQEATPLSVRFCDAAVADFFDGCIDRKLPPGRFARLWCHTHPGSSPEPSDTDEKTFERCFGNCDWAVMFILSRTNATYARLAFTAGPGSQLLIPTTVDWAAWPACVEQQGEQLAATTQSWQDEYVANVHQPPPRSASRGGLALLDLRATHDDRGPIDPPDDLPWWEVAPWSDELDTIRFRTVEEEDDCESINDKRPG
jgi:proteasome lid subunit RPN8/RPN11